MTAICHKFETAMSLLSKRWVGLIIHQLLDGPKRFSELESDIQISGKVLSDRLKALEKADIVIRDVFPETPVRIEYRLTKQGKDLKPVLDALQHWADTWVNKT
ncbi:MAG: helix-turn-helix domain-containing protein [Candidatus Izemoplasma sp.]|nr:helix-turn-helix domain-containing protein [Candidatus Izemoplasma sp.]